MVTRENLAEVLPRYFGLSAREAAVVTAELQPRPDPPLRTVVTELPLAQSAAPIPQAPAATPEVATRNAGPVQTFGLPFGVAQVPAPAAGFAGTTSTPRTEVEPLSADLRRLHMTISARLLKKIEAARDGLSRQVPNATTEHVVEAAIDLLLEKQARARGQVRRPRKTMEAAPATVLAPAPAPADTPRHRRAGPRAAIPVEVKRAVWARDGGRCTWPTDGGGCCGSTRRLELDHVVPWARGGDDTPANLRLTCHLHNRLAARREFGAPCVARYSAGGP